MYTTVYKDYLSTPSPTLTQVSIPETFIFPSIASMDMKNSTRKHRGVKYWMQKLFWVVSFLGSLFTALYFINEMWSSYKANPVVTIFNPRDIPIGILPFPAITICNINNVQQSKMEEYIKQGLKPNMSNDELKKAYSDIYNINHICRSARTFTDRVAPEYNHVTLDEKLKAEMIRRKLQVEINEPPTKILREASQSCEEMIMFCLWMDEIQNCSSLFREIETDYGYCCTFNLLPLSLLLKANIRREPEKEIMLWQEANLDSDNILLQSNRIPQSNIYSDSKHRYPRRQIFAGRSSGLSVLLFADLDEYNCTNTDSEGFLVSLNLPLDFPRMKDSSKAIPSGSEVFMNIRPELTIPDDSINSLRLDKRKCYFGDEYKLKYYAHYTTSNCIDECIADLTFLECDCVQYYMPRSTNETNVCPPKTYFCTENVRKKMIQQGLKVKCSHCLPTCTDLEYTSETTFLKIKESAMKKLLMDSNPDPRWNNKLKVKDMSIVHMYFGVDSTYPRQRKEIYGAIELVSNAGGLLSLFVGFSVMKLLKFLYELVVGLACAKSKKKMGHDNEEKHEVSSPQTVTNFRHNGNAICQHKEHPEEIKDEMMGKVFLGNVNNGYFTSRSMRNKEKVTKALMTHQYPCGTVTTVHIG